MNSEKGFTPDFSRAHRSIQTLVKDLRWERFHRPHYLVTALVLEAAELQQELQWLDGEAADALFENPAAREVLSGELADLTLNLLALASRVDIDLDEAVRAKCDELRRIYGARPGTSAQSRAVRAAHGTGA